MRTNIDIDDKLMADAMEASGARTKKAVVEAALRFMLEEKAREVAQEQRREGAWQGIMSIVGKVEFDEDYLAMMRRRSGQD